MYRLNNGCNYIKKPSQIQIWDDPKTKKILEEWIIIKQEKLIAALNQKFKENIISTTFETTPLQGGTVANVSLVTGNAETVDSETLPFRIVLKTQKQWERFADADSWRREYDLYASDLDTTFSQALRWPICYLADFNEEENEYQLWLEFIDGVSGLDLTSDMFELAALEFLELDSLPVTLGILLMKWLML